MKLNQKLNVYELTKYIFKNTLKNDSNSSGSIFLPFFIFNVIILYISLQLITIICFKLSSLIVSSKLCSNSNLHELKSYKSFNIIFSS